MGLENIGSSSTPDALNENWPDGSTDGTMFGAIHLRNIKTVLKNFYSQNQTFEDWFNSLVDQEDPDDPSYVPGIKVKRSEDTEKLGGELPAHYLDAANLESPAPNQGDKLPNNKLPVASLAQKGIAQMLTGTTSASELQAATVKSLQALVVDVESNLRKSAQVAWEEITIPGGDHTTIPLPSKILGYLSAGTPVQLRFVQDIHRGADIPGAGGQGPDGDWGLKGFMSQMVILEPEFWDSANPDNSRRSGRIACRNRNSGSTPPDNHYFYVYMGKQSDDTSFNLYNTLYTGAGGSVVHAAFRPQPDIVVA